MTLGRAIKILNYFIETGAMQPEPSFSNATKLGIEALKREQRKRTTMAFHPDDLLRGEAKE